MLSLSDELIIMLFAGVECKGDKKALRLVSRRARDLVDAGVTQANVHTGSPDTGLGVVRRWPALSWLRVHFGHAPSQEELRAVLGAPLTSLTYLEFSAAAGSGPECLAALAAAAPGWRALRSLSLSHGPQYGDAVVQALMPHACIHLEELDLCRNGLGPAAAAALSAAGWTAALSLRRLSLCDNPLLGDAGTAALAQGAWPCLESLHLSGTGLGPAGAGALAAGRQAWPALQALSLDDNCGLAGSAGVQALLGAAVWTALTNLRLSNNKLGAGGAAALAAGAALPALRSLALGGNELGGAGAWALAQARWPHLSSLDLTNNELGDAGAAAVAFGAAAQWPALRSLSLDGNDVRCDGAWALAQGRWRCLEDLSLTENCVGHAGAAALAAAACLPCALRYLALTDNFLGDSGVEALMCATWPLLDSLHVGGNDMAAGGARALAAAWTAARLPALRALSCGFNPLGDAGARALARAPCALLTRLDMTGTEVGPAGAAAMAESAAGWAALRVLRLDYDDDDIVRGADERAARDLARGAWPRLEEINFIAVRRS
jgi:Ran GTPase-activating protein (RanGAP) involved in mRNA processing and transport